MKNSYLATVTLFTAISIATMSSALYADEDVGTGTTCSSCGCHALEDKDKANAVHRETINPELDSQDSTIKQQ